MPEPRINERNFNRPTTDRENPRPNSRPRLFPRRRWERTAVSGRLRRRILKS